MPHVPQPGHNGQRRPQHHQGTGLLDQQIARTGPGRRNVLAEEHHVRLEHPAARHAVDDAERINLTVIEHRIPVSIDQCCRRSVSPGPLRIGRPQPLVQRYPRRPRPAPQAGNPVQAPMQFGHRNRPSRLVQPVHVLRDNAIDAARALELRHREVPGVRLGRRDIAPAQVAARPVPAPCRRAAGKRLIRHWGRSPREAGRSAVIRDTTLGRQSRAAKDHRSAPAEKIQDLTKRTVVPLPGQLLHPTSLPPPGLRFEPVAREGVPSYIASGPAAGSPVRRGPSRR